MLQNLVKSASRLFGKFQRALHRDSLPIPQQPIPEPLQPIRRVLLTDAVCRTLFEGFAQHRESVRGDEEIGWLLMGIRHGDEAIALATLPAGTQRRAGVAHVQFNSGAQAVASQIIRQQNRRLTILGVVHTHPGSLRHPSHGDMQGDRLWVRRLRGNEGVFAIGTADGEPMGDLPLLRRPKPHFQQMGELCYHWYALNAGDDFYRPLPVELTIGPDFAKPLHSVWDVLETHADSLEHLLRQQSNVSFDPARGCDGEPTLVASISLAQPKDQLRVLMDENAVRYVLVRDGDFVEVDPKEDHLERAVYMILAELANSV